ncbi:hypothetical protein RRG08_035254 [Elysia crispata]|uniref:Pikachurin n=1 Tax=Elysia crispata TaxID=231223 RepID=A0AAE1AT75_9GAST|nr:hypothetical protein RRG08_035254 [Elysia crispata]
MPGISILSGPVNDVWIDDAADDSTILKTRTSVTYPMVCYQSRAGSSYDIKDIIRHPLGDKNNNSETCATAVKNPCQQICVDIKSRGFFCQCRPGFNMNPDGMTCTEIWHPEEKRETDYEKADVNKDSPSYTEVDSRSDSKTRYNNDGEVMVSYNEVVHLKSIDLTRGLPPLEADNRRSSDSALVLDSRRGQSGGYSLPESSIVDSRGTYNIPEGETENDEVEISINALDITEGGDFEPEKVVDSPKPFTGELQEVEVPTCKGFMCKNNGSCAVVKGKAICLCPLGHYGKMCERDVEVRYPKFKGTGYLALPVLQDAHKELRVSLEFKPGLPDGLLLFSEGFDCGTGIAELRSLNRVQLAEWNTVVLTRVDNRATLRVNGGHQVEGVSQGDYTRITFRLNLYLGGYVDMNTIKARVGTEHQFVGCVQELRINGHRFDFRPTGSVGEAEFGINVGECSDGVCDQIQCKNNGKCVARSADRHICLCPYGYHGNSCEKNSSVHILHFSGHSYLELAGLQRSVLSYTEIELVFKPTYHDGTILYNGYSRDRRGDFISIALEAGHLVFRFDLGTGPAELRSLEPVTLNKWHFVRASRTGLLGTMLVDDEPIVSGQSQDSYTQLTLLDSLYLGGHPNYDHTFKRAQASRSFNGCLQKVVSNQKSVDMIGKNLAGVNVRPCSHPCAGKPCMNDGRCKPRLDSYVSHCKLGFFNTNCENVQDSVPTNTMFNGESYLKYIYKDITKSFSSMI